VLGVFAHVDTTVTRSASSGQGLLAADRLYARPVEEIEEEVERVRPLSKVRLFTLIGA